MKNISIIGSTGSIGVQAIDAALAQGNAISAMACGSNIKLAEEQIRLAKPEYYAVMDEDAAMKLRTMVSDTPCIVEGGQDAVLKAAAYEKADMTLNSAVGIAGLRPTLAALDSCKALALANKESLVCAGNIVMKKANENKTPILPVDSEHNAIFQCLKAGRGEEVDRLILTASGGPFFGWNSKMLSGVTPKDALKHPTWSMGQKISIDSATMMNKGFEVIEASWLFDMPQEKIDVVVHRESIVHSMVKYIDGSVIAQMGSPDMRLPIMYALNYPERTQNPFETLDVLSLGTLSFFAPDRVNFPCLALCEEATRKGGNMGVIINGANEIAVSLFLEGKIEFSDIYRIVYTALEKIAYVENPTLDEIFEADKDARRIALETK